MQLREFLASKYFDSGTWDIRVKALDRAMMQGLDLPLSLGRARVVNDLMCELSGGKEAVPEILDINSRSTQDPDIQSNAKLVEYLLRQLHKWYFAAPIEDIPVGDLPAMIFILQTFVHSFLPSGLWDTEACELPQISLKVDPGVLLSLGLYFPGGCELVEYKVKPEPSRASHRFTEGAESNASEANLFNKGKKDMFGQYDDDTTKLRNTSFDMRYKLCQLLLHPTVDRPKDAVPLLEILVMEKSLEYRSMRIALLRHPQLFLHSIDARIWSGCFDQMTQDLFAAAFRVMIENPALPESPLLDSARERLLLHRPYIKMQTGQSGEEFIPENVRGVENCFSESALRQMLAREDQPPHPVYEALGGDDWLQSRRAMLVPRDERSCKFCHTTSSVGARLKECTRCESTYYCSVTCQKRDWPVHKANCREGESLKPALRNIKKTEPKHIAKQYCHWFKWLQLSHANLLLHGLSLHRHPERGQTHIIIREVTYTPEAAQLRYSFKTIKCGVFRIEDAMSDVERFLEWPPGSKPEYFQSHIDQANTTNRIPVFILSYGQEVKPVIDTTLLNVATLPDAALYEPTWRDMINRLGDDPPAPLVLPSGIPDAEHAW